MRRAAGAAAALLLTGALTGCGDDRPVVSPPPPHPAQVAPQALPQTFPQPAPSGPPDPLLAGADEKPSDPLLSRDPMQGHGMPTAHSHWLRGRMRDAQVTVSLNGVRQGAYFTVVDQDITMRLRKGVNTVTFVYQPHSSSSSAQMEVVESEHHPPIAPLVTFQPVRPAPGNDTPAPQTRTYTFIAQ